MKLTPAELAYVRAQGLHITDRCNGCGRLLNQTVQYTITGRREVYCSALCRDTAFFGDRHEAKKRATPGKCVYCGATLEKKKRRGALYCGEKCKKRAARSGRAHSTAEPQITGTPTQSNQRVASPKIGGLGRCIASGPQPLRSARGEVAAKIGLPVEVGQATSGSRSS
jgi:hypothetical protein